MEDFLIGCIKKYKCGPFDPKNPLAGVDPNRFNIKHSQGPFVKLTIKGGDGAEITVGNPSCPGCDPTHSSIIKSFEYGSTNGFKVNITIHDLGGGTFDSLVRSMNTDSTKFNADYTMRVEWGWIECDCTTNCRPRSSIAVCFMVSSLTASMDQGKIVYEIEGTDLWKGIMQTRALKVEGDDVQAKHLKQAIRDMFAKNPEPRITDVQFLKRMEDGSKPKEWVFKKYGKEGPEAKWEPAQRTKIAVALDWLKGYVTEADKGISKFTWNINGTCEPSIIFWEDNAGCVPKVGTTGCIRTYIVNGGKESSVVSFQPKYKWDYTHLQRAGGQSNAANTTRITAGSNLVGDNNCGLGMKGTGNMIGGETVGSESFERAAGKNAAATEEGKKNTQKNLNNNTPKIQPVEADITVHGDPDLVATLQTFRSWVSIIVVNPFHLTGGKSVDEICPDWTNKPPCNSMMSNRCWFIEGINHSIKEGSYLTTLKIFLAAPGATTATGKPLGCNGPIIN